jgi:hypothetical protein
MNRRRGGGVGGTPLQIISFGKTPRDEWSDSAPSRRFRDKAPVPTG